MKQFLIEIYNMLVFEYGTPDPLILEKEVEKLAVFIRIGEFDLPISEIKIDKNHNIVRLIAYQNMGN